VPLRTERRKYAQQDAEGGVTGFATPSRRVELYSERLVKAGYPAVPDAGPDDGAVDSLPLLMTNAKNGYFCHSQHRGLSSLRRKHPDPTVEIAPDLARARTIAEGDQVEIITARGA